MSGELAQVNRIGVGPTARVEIPVTLLVRLYCVEQKSTLEIGVFLGVSKKTVRLRLMENGIGRRTLREAFAVSTTHAQLLRAKGDKCLSWKGGRKLNQGYVMLYMPDHPDAAKYGGYVFEHRLLMEQIIGRPLRPGEEVHHENEQRDDNRPENLLLMTKADHMRHHAAKRHAEGDASFGFKKGGAM